MTWPDSMFAPAVSAARLFSTPSVRMLVPGGKTPTTHPPSREHPMLRDGLGKVTDSVPSCERLGTGGDEITSARLHSS